MSAQLLPTVEVNPATPPTAALIWLHGLGADGHDFANIVPELQLPTELALRFIAPHAPVRPITLNGGYPMRAWYDILGLTSDTRQDADGIRATEQEIARLIENEIQRGIPASRIFLGGFSQGGAMALHCALRFPQRLGGLIALSTYLPLAPVLAHEASLSNRDLPIFLAHGDADPVVPMSWGQISLQHLTSLHYKVTWRIYSMGHSVCQPEIKDISNWLQQTITDSTILV